MQHQGLTGLLETADTEMVFDNGEGRHRGGYRNRQERGETGAGSSKRRILKPLPKFRAMPEAGGGRRCWLASSGQLRLNSVGEASSPLLSDVLCEKRGAGLRCMEQKVVRTGCLRGRSGSTPTWLFGLMGRGTLGLSESIERAAPRRHRVRPFQPPCTVRRAQQDALLESSILREESGKSKGQLRPTKPWPTVAVTYAAKFAWQTTSINPGPCGRFDCWGALRRFTSPGLQPAGALCRVRSDAPPGS